jgi:hypothetical protein
LPDERDEAMKQAPKMPFPITLCDDLSVVTQDGEYLGTWSTGETDAIYDFTPDGASEALLFDPYRWSLCEKIQKWHEAK